MQPNIRIGQTFSFEITVTPEMRAQFDGQTVHHLYGTAAMTAHMEWASRQHILPCLDEGEEGVGAHIEVRHLAPVAIGEIIRIDSVVTGVLPRRVVCHCTAWHGHKKVGEGKVIQAILPLRQLHEKIASIPS